MFSFCFYSLWAVYLQSFTVSQVLLSMILLACVIFISVHILLIIIMYSSFFLLMKVLMVKWNFRTFIKSQVENCRINSLKCIL